MFMSTLETSDTLPSSFLNLLSSVNLVQHVNFTTHIENHTLDLLITSFLLRYHALLSTSLIITSSWLTSKLTRRSTPPSNSLFSTNRLHRPSSLHQKYSRLPTHSQPSRSLFP